MAPAIAVAAMSGSTPAGKDPSLTPSAMAVDQGLPPRRRIGVVEGAHLGIVLGGLDERGGAPRDRGVTEGVGQVLEQLLDPLPRRRLGTEGSGRASAR